jgi:hypothetical protein
MIRNSLYVRRPEVERELANAVRSGLHLVVFGLPGTGKTLLPAQRFKPKQSLYIQCGIGQKPPDLYRSLLAHVGCRVQVSTRLTRKKRMAGNVGLVGGDAETSTERAQPPVSQMPVCGREL